MPTVRPELADPIEQPIEAEPSFGYRTVAGLQGKNPIGDGYDGSCEVFASGGIRWRYVACAGEDGATCSVEAGMRALGKAGLMKDFSDFACTRYPRK